MLALLAALSFAASAPSISAEADTPEHAVCSFFRAMATDDDAALSRLASRGFYAFDNGKRFDGRALFDLVKSVHPSGKVLVWTLGPIDVHRRGSLAWAAGAIHGAVGAPGAMTPVNWLESANLHREGRVWVLDFLNSARSATSS